jgi:tetratricopeptide (TPR) repeat protein
MSGSNGSDGENAKAVATKFKWTCMTIIVLAIIGYAIYTGTPIEEIVFEKLGFSVSFQTVDQKDGASTYESPSATSDFSASSESDDWFIDVPGENPLPLSRVDWIMLESGDNDPQNRHVELVKKALETGTLNVKYEEPDRMGQFSVWLTYSEEKAGRKTFSYTTRLIQADGTIEIACREAYRASNTWYSQISPELQSLMNLNGDTDTTALLNRPRIRRVNEILQALNDQRHLLVRGQLTARGLLNSCFVDGEITEEDVRQATLQGRLLGKEIGLTFDATGDVAEFGYALYQEGEYLGSKTFWEALIVLNPRDAYCRNMLGASLECLNQLEPALREYEKAVELDPQYAHAKENVNRVQAILSNS